MNTSNANGYLLISHTDEWYKELSLAELQEVINQNKAWVERLMAQGKVKGGLALGREGATVFASKRVVSDGPFAESKEAIGGTLLLDVATMEEAIAIARACPSLRHNSTIEVRPISDDCPLNLHARKLEQQLAMADA
jgi:hypothetical protein